MAENPTIGELFKAKAIADEHVTVAVDAYMAAFPGNEFVLSGEYVLNLRKAVRSHAWASAMIANDEATDHLKRAAVRTAILLARPERR